MEGLVVSDQPCGISHAPKVVRFCPRLASDGCERSTFPWIKRNHLRRYLQGYVKKNCENSSSGIISRSLDFSRAHASCMVMDDTK